MTNGEVIDESLDLQVSQHWFIIGDKIREWLSRSENGNI